MGSHTYVHVLANLWLWASVSWALWAFYRLFMMCHCGNCPQLVIPQAWGQWNKVKGKKLLKGQEPQTSLSNSSSACLTSWLQELLSYIILCLCPLFQFEMQHGLWSQADMGLCVTSST